MTKPRKIIFILLLAVVIAASGFVASRSSRNAAAPRPTSETLSIIKSATSIETFQVKSSGSFGSERIGDYFIAGHGLIPDPETVKQLKAIFLTHLHGEANPHGMKACGAPEPGVAIRFIQGDKAVDILVCFRCYDLLVVNDASSEWRDFNYPEAERDALVKIAKVLSPNDSEIQELRTDN